MQTASHTRIEQVFCNQKVRTTANRIDLFARLKEELRLFTLGKQQHLGLCKKQNGLQGVQRWSWIIHSRHV